MDKRVLYFPYIRVPESAWFTRMLLYWDRVGAIVPSDYIQKPEQLGEHMRSLVEHQLVEQVIPGMHINEVPRFKDAFAEYIVNLGTEIENRRIRFRHGHKVLVHIEKMDSISDVLTEHMIARPCSGPWYEVEPFTADDFMSYLAVVLGKLERVKAVPITDNQSYLMRFSEAGVPSNDKLEHQLSVLRLDVLEQILPSPERPLDAVTIERFKNRYGHYLNKFRRRVERELLTVADIRDPLLRARRLALFYEEAEEIKSMMQKSGFGRISFGNICALVAAIPGVPPVFGLANAVYQAFRNTDHNLLSVLSSDLAYAAYAHWEFNLRVGR